MIIGTIELFLVSLTYLGLIVRFILFINTAFIYFISFVVCIICLSLLMFVDHYFYAIQIQKENVQLTPTVIR